MIKANPAVAISCSALLIAALAATSYYIGSQEKKAQQATIQSGVVLLPGETLVALPDPVVAKAAPAPVVEQQAAAPVKSRPEPTPPRYRKHPAPPQYTRQEVLRNR